ncbi:MAG: lipoate protein ligase C-terminal domain-containing protein [Nitrososphaerales archaeon]
MNSLLLKSEYKVKGGKMIKVTLDVEENVIRRALIAGDFFLYPEEAIEQIEESLRGLNVVSLDLERVLSDAVMRSGAQLLGVAVEDIASAVRLALQSGSH